MKRMYVATMEVMMLVRASVCDVEGMEPVASAAGSEHTALMPIRAPVAVEMLLEGKSFSATRGRLSLSVVDGGADLSAVVRTLGRFGPALG